MRSGPIGIDGVAGEVVVETRMLGRPVVLVDGVPAPRLRGAWCRLPTDDGRGVPVLVRGGAGMSPHPRLVLGDEVHATGPAPPGWLQLLAVAPVPVSFLGGGPGVLVGLLGLVLTWWVLRRPWAVRTQAVAVAAVVLVTVLVSLALGRPRLVVNEGTGKTGDLDPLEGVGTPFLL